ncbi:hypothetical protein I4U23_006991 [Adineta vaga]|nr:hypothetical protein I4U23_006991 [Adineta vaga]
MSIQRTAESALHSLEELYRAIDSASQQSSPMSMDESENLVQALCNLSQLIQHINHTGMCDQTSMMTTHIDSNQFHQKRKPQTFFTPHLNHYDENIYTNSVPIEQSLPIEQPYGECILYHPIRSQTHDRSLKSSRRSTRSSKSRHRRRSYSHGRQSRSSQRNNRRSRSSQRRSQSRRRSSHKHRSSHRKYHDRQIPSRPVPTDSSYPSNQISSTSAGNQPSSQQEQQTYIRSLPSSAPRPKNSSSSVLPNSLFNPTIPLPPPPPVSSLHNSHLSANLPVHGSRNPTSNSMINPLSAQSSVQQQISLPTTDSQQPSTDNGILSSNFVSHPTTDGLLTSRSDNCPECRAITRLLQWAPLKCYDAAGIRRGVFLAGPKSEQLLKALYSSIKDSSFSLDNTEDCLCDNE